MTALSGPAPAHLAMLAFPILVAGSFSLAPTAAHALSPAPLTVARVGPPGALMEVRVRRQSGENALVSVVRPRASVE